MLDAPRCMSAGPIHLHADAARGRMGRCQEHPRAIWFRYSNRHVNSFAVVYINNTHSSKHVLKVRGCIMRVQYGVQMCMKKQRPLTILHTCLIHLEKGKIKGIIGESFH